MSHFLTEEQELMRGVAREFAQKEIAPIAKQLDATHEFPWAWVKRCAPVYPPFYSSIVKNRRQVVENPLVVEDGRYVMDFVIWKRRCNWA